MTRLVQASGVQKRERDALCHQEWGGRLTPAQFLAREERLRAHSWAAGGMTTWLWMDDGGEVLGSCETFRMESWLGPERGDSYGVASVFVEPRLRGQGIAESMIKALIAALRAGPGRPHSSILFSDVGATLYERAGYVAVKGTDRVFAPLSSGGPSDGVDQLFKENELAPQLERTPRPRHEQYVVWPTADQLDWHVERERIYSQLLSLRRPWVHGARLGESVVFWVADLKNSKLMIELLVARSTEDAVALLRSARRVASALSLREVSHWALPTDPPWPDGEEGGRLVARDGSLPMIAPLDPRVDPHGWRVVPRALWI